MIATLVSKGFIVIYAMKVELSFHMTQGVVNISISYEFNVYYKLATYQVVPSVKMVLYKKVKIYLK